MMFFPFGVSQWVGVSLVSHLFPHQSSPSPPDECRSFISLTCLPLPRLWHRTVDATPWRRAKEEDSEGGESELYLKPYLFLSRCLNLHKAGSNQILPGPEDWVFSCIWLQCHRQRFSAVKPLLYWESGNWIREAGPSVEFNHACSSPLHRFCCIYCTFARVH